MLPIEADAKEIKPLVETVKGINRAYFFELNNKDHLFALAEWREADLIKRLKSLYLKLPDYAYVDFKKV